MLIEKPNALSFCREYLKKKPKAPFAEIRDAAAEKKIKLYPISFGRAQSLEGLVKTKPRAVGESKKAKATVAKKRGRPVGSKNKPKAGVALPGLDGLVANIKLLQKERDDALSTLARIRDLMG